MLYGEVLEYLAMRGRMDDSQHGARKARSTLIQLLEQHQRLLSILENGRNVDVVFLDFSKVFDLIDHSMMLEKLAALGISGNFLRWIASFLTESRQRVRV